MFKFEKTYINLILTILDHGELKEGRNGNTKSVFGETLRIDMSNIPRFPLLRGRKIFYEGIFGELAAMLRGPKCLADFEKFGCNYWKQWANPDGSINIDYGNKWLDFNGVNQLEEVKNKLRSTPNDRRILIDAWDPSTLLNNSLPCCHFLYQWYVRDKTFLDMEWYQRSVDTMVGLPSDIVLAALWNILLANEVGLKPGRIKMDLGDTHIYEEHFEQAREYASYTSLADGVYQVYPDYELVAPLGMRIEDFVPSMLQISNYNPQTVMKFEVKA